MQRKKIIIDTDAGVDDAWALCLALMNPEWEVIGITCVCGNVDVDRMSFSTLNTLRSSVFVLNLTHCSRGCT